MVTEIGRIATQPSASRCARTRYGVTADLVVELDGRRAKRVRMELDAAA